MKRFLITIGMIAALASPLAAQQDSVRVPVEEARAVQTSTLATPLPGPLVRPPFARADASARAPAMPPQDSHTITVTTLVLVLAVVILVLVLVR